MNTWGVFSVNNSTFIIDERKDNQLSQKSRDKINTCMMIHNTILNLLGYLPGVSFISGLVRIGSSIAAYNFAKRHYHLKDAHLLEARETLAAQIARGILESMVPLGFLVNLGADIVGTFYNFYSDYKAIEALNSPLPALT